MTVDSYQVKQDDNGQFALWIVQNGKEGIFERMPKAYALMDAESRKACVDAILSDYDIKVKEPKKVFLKEPKKVILKIAKDNKKIYGYVLYLKGTSKCIYRMDEKGIYLMDMNNKPTTKPLYFTKEDIEMIGNLDEFDVKKVELSGKYIRNKIK